MKLQLTSEQAVILAAMIEQSQWSGRSGKAARDLHPRLVEGNVQATAEDVNLLRLLGEKVPRDFKTEQTIGPLFDTLEDS